MNTHISYAHIYIYIYIYIYTHLYLYTDVKTRPFLLTAVHQAVVPLRRMQGPQGHDVGFVGSNMLYTDRHMTYL